MEFKPLSAALLLLLGITVRGTDVCPPDPATAMQNCAKDINIDLNSAEGHKFITDKAYTNKICGGGKEVDDALACMEVIYTTCIKSGVLEKDLLVKPQSWKKAIKKVCHNRDFLAKNAGCIMKNAEDTSTCIEKYTKEATANINVKHVDIAATQGQAREKFKIICDLSHDLMTCFDDALLKDCPKKMRTIVDDIVYSFLPPVCHPDPADSKTPYQTVNDKPSGNAAARVSAISSVFVAAILYLCAFV